MADAIIEFTGWLRTMPWAGSCAGVPAPHFENAIIWRGAHGMISSAEHLLTNLVMDAPEAVNIRGRVGMNTVHVEVFMVDGSRFEADAENADIVLNWMSHIAHFSGSVVFNVTEVGTTRVVLP